MVNALTEPTFTSVIASSDTVENTATLTSTNASQAHVIMVDARMESTVLIATVQTLVSKDRLATTKLTTANPTPAFTDLARTHTSRSLVSVKLDSLETTAKMTSTSVTSHPVLAPLLPSHATTPSEVSSACVQLDLKVSAAQTRSKHRLQKLFLPDSPSWRSF